MKSLGRFPDSFWAEISAQPSALRRVASDLEEWSAELGSIRERAVSGSAVFTGMGASYAACHVPITLLAGRGRNATMVDAAELVHFRRPILRADTLLVVVSQSGRSAEAVKLIDAIRHGPRPFVVSITNGSDNELARHADVPFDTRAGREVGPATMTFGATLVALATLAQVMSGDSVSESVAFVKDEAQRAAAALEAILADGSDDLPRRLVDWLGGRRTFVVLGRGTARAAAETAALLLKEAARLPAEALEAGQFRHGPLEIAGPDLAAAVIATEPSTAALDLSLAEELADAGAAVLVVGAGERPRESVEHLPIGGVGRALVPAVAVLPFQMLGWRLAIDGGMTPGRLSRATKVTTRE